jgi:hypothetical protein
MEGHDIFSSVIQPNARHDFAHAHISSPHTLPQNPGFEYDDEEQRMIEQRLADLGYLE